MAGLQRSATTFRRSGSSGLVWDERFLSGDLSGDGQTRKGDQEDDGGVVEFRELRHSQSVGSARTSTSTATTAPTELVRSNSLHASDRRSGGFRAASVPPAAEPPSPDVSGCILCQILRKPRSSSTAATKRPGPRRH